MHGPLKDKKNIVIAYAFRNFLDESNRKPNKIWVDKGSKFFNSLMKSLLQGKSVGNLLLLKLLLEL